MYRHLIRPLGNDLYTDMARRRVERQPQRGPLEEIVRAAELDWTFVRPTHPRDGETAGAYRVSDNSTPANGWKIARVEVAGSS